MTPSGIKEQEDTFISLVFTAMNQLICVVVLLTCTIINAYDFQDSHYNQFLLEDLEDMKSIDPFMSTHPRIRRDEENSLTREKCRKKRVKLCCDTDFMENFRKDTKESRKECYREFIADENRSLSPIDALKCDRSDKHRNDILCVMQCIGKKENMVDEEGGIKIKEFTSLVRKSVKDEWAIPLLDNIIRKCVEEVEDTINTTPIPTLCNPAFTKAEYCVFKELQINCPEDKIKDQNVCNKLKDRKKPDILSDDD